ncbi:MAG: carboxypeptidase-like regulatory domain-containing protein [Fimbriimonadaceae bacterium]|nr:carboxypeptidase regulatory-like domain-containing protein [Chthonomonadaceae bacterium]MCO5297531.1 carboxypeptidase-like regulatory domain-containing protein [Fimbriimonadaceae bacterium]
MSLAHAWAQSPSANPAQAFDVYITVGKGPDGEDGPVAKAQVTLSGPGTRLNPQSKSTDEEGVAKFTVPDKGRYFVEVKAGGFAPFEGRMFVEETVTHYFAALAAPSQHPDKARIVVYVKDSESGWPIDGAAVKTQRADASTADHMNTDDGGRAYVVMRLAPEAKGGLTFEVTVSHPDYEPQTQRVVADKDVVKDYPLTFTLRRAKGLRLFTATVLEAGTRAPVPNAKVVLDGGRDNFFSVSTGPDGKALFRLPPSVSYEIKISTSLYDEETDKLDLASESGVVQRTYELSRKGGGAEIRRALIVTVRYKDDKGANQPLKDAVVVGPGLHGSATDANGQIVFLHTVPPGETITVTASSPLFKTGSADVLVRDKGVMVDLKQFTRDTARGMGDLEAIRKQGVQGYDTALILLEMNKIEAVKRVVGKIETGDESTPGEPVAYATELTYADGDSDVVTVEEVIQVLDASGAIVDRKGSVRTLNRGEPSTQSFRFDPPKPGTYRIKSAVSWDRGVLWTGEKTVKVSEDRRKIALSGDVVAKKGKVNLDERIDVNVNVLYNAGPTERVTLRERVELFDPKGEVVQNNLGERALTRGSYSLRNFAITCQAPGMYRLKSTILGLDNEVLWSGEGTFEVANVGKPVTKKPGQGYYRLVKRTVGNVPGPAVGPEGTFSGSISESSFALKYESKPPYDAHIDIQVQYSTPPTIIKANDTVELTVQGTASVTGRDVGSTGIGAGWYVTGSGSLVEGRNIFLGKASSGMVYNSGSTSFKIKVGSGGALRIGNSQGGQTWGSSDNWNPGTYDYEWVPNEAPPDPVKPAGQPTLQAGAASDKPGDAEGSYSALIPISRGETIDHWVRVQIKKAANANTYSVTGSIMATAKSKGFQIQLSGTYFGATNKISGRGTSTYPNTSYVVDLGGSFEGGQPRLLVTIRQPKGTYVKTFSVTLKRIS